MLIVHRHLLASYLRNLAYTIAGSLVLFTVMDLLDHISSLTDNEATWSMALRYYLYKSAWIIDTVLPISLLMATLFTIGAMARYLELTALFAAGWSLLRITRPLLAVAVVATLFSVAWREYVLPEANVRRERVWEVEIHKKPDRIRPTQHIAVRGSDDRIYMARRFDPNTGLLTGLRIVTRDGPRVVERIDARRAEWDGNQWTLIEGAKRVFDGDREVVIPFDRLVAADLSIEPRSFYRNRISREDMNIRQLMDYGRLVRETGGDPTETEVDIHFNLAWPLVNLIVVFMGLVLASGPRKANIASGFGTTLLVSFGYYMLMNFGRALGHSGAVPPWLAGWGGNGVYTLLSLVLFVRARR
jgi:lipopolysaccharide export system permease protein